MFILVLIFGIVIGALLMNLAVEEEKYTNTVLKKTIDFLQESLDNANFRVEQRNSLIKDLKEEQETLLNNSAELRSKNIYLENNIEFMLNNKKELADRPKSN